MFFIIGMFDEQKYHSASIVTATTCTLYCFTTSAIEQLKTEQPSVTTALHEYVLRLLADRLVKTVELVEELLEIDE
jgi:CRP-like cAMP-binding protein